jgi:hypothetical protein
LFGILLIAVRRAEVTPRFLNNAFQDRVARRFPSSEMFRLHDYPDGTTQHPCGAVTTSGERGRSTGLEILLWRSQFAALSF